MKTYRVVGNDNESHSFPLGTTVIVVEKLENLLHCMSKNGLKQWLTKEEVEEV